MAEIKTPEQAPCLCDSGEPWSGDFGEINPECPWHGDEEHRRA